MPNPLPDPIGNEFFTMDVSGVNRVANGLRRAAADMPGVCTEVAYVWGQETRSILRSTPYPPKRPKQKYRRTGLLANSWRAARLKGGVTILNTAHRRGRFYSRYVVGNAKGLGQAWMHKGRWWTARSVIDDRIPEFTRALSTRLTAEIEQDIAKG